MPKKLLFSVTKKDLTIQTFKAGGKGGQHQNTTDSGVRIIHNDSGARGESRNHRSRHANKKEALKRLVDSVKFKTWMTRMFHEVMEGKTLDEKVDEMMNPKNIKIETKDENGKWKQNSK